MKMDSGPAAAHGATATPDRYPISTTTDGERRWRAALDLAGAVHPILERETYFGDLDLPFDDAYGALASASRLLEFEKRVSAYTAPYLRHAAAAVEFLVTKAEKSKLVASMDVGANMLLALRDRLVTASSKVVAALINVARLTGEVTGESSADRWQEFEQLLLDKEFRLRCRDRFPVLDEIMAVMTSDAEDAWREFFERLQQDRTAIEDLFPGGLGKIIRLNFYAGDAHNRGRSVVLVFGERGRLVYKPRSLRTDEALGTAIKWLDSHTGLGMRHLPVINRSNYGWIGFAEHSSCKTTAEVESCFVRTGALMALMYILGASDLHYENIICAGDQPKIVDAEVLFNGSLNMAGRLMRARQRARIESVSNLYYLPMLLPMGGSFVDITGGGFVPGQEIELRAAIESDASNDLTAQPKTIKLPRSFNLPILDGVAQPASLYRQAITEGFRIGLSAIAEHRAELLSRPDLMPSFAEMPSRFIARGTAAYGQIFRNALHPHAVADRSRHDAALSILARSSGWPERVMRQILTADILALRRGDIPFYKSVANSRHLWTADGHQISNVFQESGFDAAVRRIKRLNATEIKRQTHAIQLAFGISAGRDAQIGRDDRCARGKTAREARLAVATKIGDRLLDQALRADAHIFWLGRAQVGTRFSMGMLETDMYGGTAGIGIFFSELARSTGLERFRRAALLCRKTAQHSASDYGPRIGAFDGLAGLVFSELAISRALNLPIATPTLSQLGVLRDQIASDRTFDIISGSAGVLLVANAAQDWAELAPTARELANICADHILAHATQVGDALAWAIPSQPNPLTGMAHGACGIGMALAEHAARTGREDCFGAALKALRFARQSFDEEQGAWRDLRGDGDGHMVAWCHGTAGIVLARQRFVELASAHADDVMKREIDFGLAALRHGKGPNSDTLCHGRSGNWEPLWRGKAEDREVAEQQVSSLCEHLGSGLKPGGDFSEPTPDLMNGLAGIGLQILRSIDRSTADVTTLSLRNPSNLGR